MNRILLFVMLMLTFIISPVASSESVIITLNFPQENNAKAAPPKALEKAEEISGVVTIDITPYPEAIKDRYMAEYFLDEHLLYQTSGFTNDYSENIGFLYKLDTTQFPDGKHKLIVNFWDKNGPSAIGIKEVLINNKNE